MRSAKISWLRSLRMQLMATYVAGFLLTAVGVAALVTTIVGRSTDDLTLRGLTVQARWIAEDLRFDESGRPFAIHPDRNSPWLYEGAPKDLKYRVVDSTGQVMLSSEMGGRALSPENQSFDPSRRTFELVMDGLQLHVLTVAVKRPGTQYYVQVARSERIGTFSRRALGRPVVQVTFWMGLISLVLFGVAVYVTILRTLRPLREASDAASRIEAANLSKRLITDRLPTEIVPLVDAFNLALDRLECGYRLQQEFLAGAAHELKTPLALIRGQLEMEGEGEIDRLMLLRDVDLMARQVHQLLHLAEVSESQSYAYRHIDIVPIASEVMGHLGRLADKHQVTLRLLNPVDRSVVSADRSAVFVLIRNLVENAIHHSPLGGIVTLEFSVSGFSVRDQGAGIALPDFPNLFKRFWRGAERKDVGAGLGLAICREIAIAHGWHLSACNAAYGATFNLMFMHSDQA
jgi:two-component system, OmpR family, sensor histidine kinase QseC